MDSQDKCAMIADVALCCYVCYFAIFAVDFHNFAGVQGDYNI